MSTLILATLLFLLFSLPILTIPMALCGLYRALRSIATGARTGELMADFWGGVRENWVHGSLGGLVGLLFASSAWLWVVMLWQQASVVAQLAGWLFVWLGLFGLMVNVFLWPLMAWYPQPALKALKRAALLAVAHPFRALLGALVPPVVLVVPFFVGVPLNLLLPLYVLVGPSVVVCVSAYFAWQAMKRYAPDDEFVDGLDPFEDEGVNQKGVAGSGR